jgi:hypothetical protein
MYYILYPKNHNKKVVILEKEPNPLEYKDFGFCDVVETKREAIIRLNWLNIDYTKRPKNFEVL